MKYIGICAVIFSVFMIWRSYTSYLACELGYTSAFLRALRDYREKMKCYLSSPSEWARGFSDEELSAIGFTERVRDGESLISAYRAVKHGIFLSKKTDEILTSCFERLGEGYLDTELEALETAISKIESEEAMIAEEMPKRQKAAGALLGACAVGTVILII